jgi:hypothetical protein
MTNHESKRYRWDYTGFTRASRIKHAEICGEIDQQLPSGNFDFGFVWEWGSPKIIPYSSLLGYRRGSNLEVANCRTLLAGKSHRNTEGLLGESLNCKWGMSHCHVSYRRVTLVCATPGVVFSAGAESPVSGNLHEVPVCWFESGVVLAQNSQLVPLCLEDHPQFHKE